MSNGVAVKTAPNEIPLPDKYVKLGLTDGYNPLPIEDARIYITGLSGEGKTTFVSSIPGAWVIDCEGGAGGIPGRRGKYFDLKAIARKTSRTRYDVYKEIIDNLMADGKANRRPCRRIVLDTHDAWVELMCRHLLEEKSTATKTYEDIGEYGQKGHGHSLLQGRCRRVLGDLEDVGYTWAVVGHLKYVTMPDPMDPGKEVTFIRPILSVGYSGIVKRISELQITIQSRTQKERKDRVVQGRTLKSVDEVEVTKYKLFTRSTERRATEGKRRGVPNLPATIEVPIIDGWGALKTAYEEAIKTSRKQYETTVMEK
ncbi:hypothetical protein LCGC14_1125590 [marine sediment metagenome]|uniref:Uncharacterized protein n=1 Tax=marine sediment metagenome TaxID=412755 RepID=A0A0F9PKR0_9ZZZZ